MRSISEAAGCGARISGARDTDGALTIRGGRALELLCETGEELRPELAATAGGRDGWNRVGGEATALREELADFWGIVARGDSMRCGAVGALE